MHPLLLSSPPLPSDFRIRGGKWRKGAYMWNTPEVDKIGIGRQDLFTETNHIYSIY